MSLSKPNASTPSNTRIISKFVNLTNMPMDGISFQVRYSEHSTMATITFDMI